MKSVVAVDTPQVTKHDSLTCSPDVRAPERMTSFSKNIDRTILTLALIAVLGLILRMFHLGDHSLWLDEAITVRMIKQSFVQIVKGSWHTNPPLYFLILHAWTNLFGQSEFALRFLSTILGTGAIVLTGLLAFSLFDRKTGILAAFFMAIMVFPLHYSREARSYALFVFAATGSFYYLHQSLASGSLRKWLGYLSFSTLMCYSHNYWVFCSLSQNLYVFFFFRKEKQILRRWLIFQALLVLFTFPWLVVLVGKTRHILEAGFWIPRPNLAYLLKTFRSYVDFLVNPQIVWGYLTVLLLGLSEPLLVRRSNTQDEPTAAPSRANALLSLWLACSILSPFLLSLWMTPIYVIRFTIGAVPAFYILLARGILILSNRHIRRAAVIIVVLVSSMSLYHYYTFRPTPRTLNPAYFIFPQHRWREFLSNIKADDVLFVHPTYYIHLPIYYGKKSQSHPLKKIQDQDDLSSLLKGKKRLWIVILGTPKANQQSLVDAIGHRFQKMNTTLVTKPTGYETVWIFHLQNEK